MIQTQFLKNKDIKFFPNKLIEIVYFLIISIFKYKYISKKTISKNY